MDSKVVVIEIPSMGFTGDEIDFFNQGSKYKGCGGIYFLYGEDGGLFNIGSTDDLYVRICQKLIGKNGGRELIFISVITTRFR